MSKLLLNEQPLLVMPELATKIGLNESIILQQIHYWLEINKKSNTNYYDGRHWTFNSYDQWQNQFPFWSVRTIRRTISKLEISGLVISGNYNKLKIDNTKWYTINYKMLGNLDNMPCGQNDQTEGSKCPDTKDKMTTPLPETKSKTKSKTNILHHLSENDGTYIGFYLWVMSKHGLKHKRVNDDNYNLIIETITDLIDEGLEEDYWQSAVKEHFANLSDGNDGDILCFLTAKSRYFPEYSEVAY